MTPCDLWSHVFSSEMDSKAVVLVFCVLLAASFMSETEAVYSQNPDNNGKRSLKLGNVRRNIRNLCASMNDVCKTERDELQDFDQLKK